jgi:hypothetical protein
MITYAIHWLEEQTAIFKKMGIVIDNINTTRHFSFYVDFISSGSFARFILWEDGNCELEVLSITTEKTTFVEHRQLYNEHDIEMAFIDLLRKM